jgi:hypothetical protein
MLAIGDIYIYNWNKNTVMGVYYGSNNQYFSYGGFIKRNPTINIEKHGGFIIKKTWDITKMSRISSQQLYWSVVDLPL